MSSSEASILMEALILMEEGADPAVDRVARENGRVRRTIVAVPEPSAAAKVAVELVDDGVDLIELDGGFGPIWAAKVIEAVGEWVPVGFVSFGIESMEGAAAFKARYEAQRS